MRMLQAHVLPLVRTYRATWPA